MSVQRISAVVAAMATTLLVANVEPVKAGDFASPTSASLDGSFRNTRLSMENNRQNHNNTALSLQAAGGGGAGSLYDEYQQSGAYQNVIWVPMENIGDNTTINVTIGDTNQSATDSSATASNEIAACSDNILNNSGSCESN